MKDTQRRRATSFHRILDSVAENPLATPIPAATTLVTELTTTTTSFDTLAAQQDLGFGTVHGAALDRVRLRGDLWSMIKDLSDTAKVLDPYAHPGLAAEMRLGRAKSSSASLCARARAIHTALVPAKQTFIDYSFSATVDADLNTMISTFESVVERKNNGRASHIGGTFGLEALCSSGVQIARKLDAIFSKACKNDLVKFAAWQAARRVERNPQATPAESTPPATPAPTPNIA